MEIRVEVFDRICRVCLSECANMRSLFAKIEADNRNLYDILAFTANIEFKFDDTLPKQVCSECESIMCKADAFKKRCLQSDTILNEVYKNTQKEHNAKIKCLVKDETNDFNENIDELDPYKPSNSSECYFQNSLDRKNVLLHGFPLSKSYDIDTDKLTDSKVHVNVENTIKIEVLNNIDEQDDLSDHYNDATNESVPIEYNQEEIKTEGKQTCYCSLEFETKAKYDKHTKYCIKYIKLMEKLSMKNIEKLSTKNIYHCVECDKDFDNTQKWTSHQKRHRNDKRTNITEVYQCSICLRKYKTKSSLTKHIRRHKEAKKPMKHTCEICKREFMYKANLENHLLSAHSRTDGFTCEVCSKGFSSPEGLEIHKESHKTEKKHQCNICHKGFVMLCTLKEHLRTHTGEKPFLCSQCGRGFSQKTNLAQHMRRHQGLKAFKCETCEKRFVSKGELDAHGRKHSGAHPFVCDECGNGFTTSSALVKHRRIHSGERPYLCDLCPMRFAASGTLTNHRRTHTGERPYQCSYCEKAFVQRHDLISHIRCHTGERPYVCTQCGQAFRKAAGLKVHVKMHSKEVNPIMLGNLCNEQ